MGFSSVSNLYLESNYRLMFNCQWLCFWRQDCLSFYCSPGLITLAINSFSSTLQPWPPSHLTSFHRAWSSCSLFSSLINLPFILLFYLANSDFIYYYPLWYVLFIKACQNLITIHLRPCVPIRKPNLYLCPGLKLLCFLAIFGYFYLQSYRLLFSIGDCPFWVRPIALGPMTCPKHFNFPKYSAWSFYWIILWSLNEWSTEHSLDS